MKHRENAESPQRKPGLLNRIHERGAYGTILALALPLFVGSMGLAVDISHYLWVRGQLQNTADAGALAGAKSLNSTATGVTASTTVSSTYATKYKVNGHMIAASELAQNQAGKWDFTSKSFTTTGVDPASTNAVRVTVARQNVPNFFARILSGALKTQTIQASAIAVAGGAGAIPCGFPTAIASCEIQTNSDNSVVCPANLSFQNGPLSVGLTLPDGASPVSGNNAKPYFHQALGAGCNLPVTMGKTLFVQNGNDLTKTTVDEINAATNNGARPVSVVLPVLDMTCGSGGATYNGSAKVVGFMQMRLIGARWTGSAPAAVATACPTLGTKNLCMAPGCSRLTTAPGGGTIEVAGDKVYLVQ